MAVTVVLMQILPLPLKTTTDHRLIFISLILIPNIIVITVSVFTIITSSTTPKGLGMEAVSPLPSQLLHRGTTPTCSTTTRTFLSPSSKKIIWEICFTTLGALRKTYPGLKSPITSSRTNPESGPRSGSTLVSMSSGQVTQPKSSEP